MKNRLVEVNNLSISYYKNDEFHVDNVSFYLEKGEVLGIIGRNGAGKTTLLKSIVGLKEKDGGDVYINGLKQGEDNKNIKEIIGYVSSDWMYELTTKLNVQAKFLGGLYKDFSYGKFEEMCERLGVNKKANPLFLSAGEKVKFTLAFALSHFPKLLIMDEPFSCLDPISRDEVMEILRELIEEGQVSIIYSTHMIHELEMVADRILFMDSGCQKLFMDVNEIQDKYFKGRKMNLEELF